MKTHDFARALMHLARALKSCPNMELKDWTAGGEILAGRATSSGNGPSPTPDSGLALSVLVGLSRYSKSQWEGLIAEWGLPVDVQRYHSIRDIAGKVLSYLERNPDAANRITDASVKKSAKASPELARVLASMLGGQKATTQPSQGGSENSQGGRP